MRFIHKILRRVSVWTWSDPSPRGPTSYGIKISFPWRDKKPPPQNLQDRANFDDKKP